MKNFKNVDVEPLANLYFAGKVSSRTLVFADGSKKTLGIMLPGEYQFGTSKKERMEIQAGLIEVLLPDQTEWLVIEAGEVFEVAANATFDIRVREATDYCCSYLED